MNNAGFEVLIEVLLKIQFVWLMTSCQRQIVVCGLDDLASCLFYMDRPLFSVFPENGTNKFLGNMGTYLPVDTVTYSRRQICVISRKNTNFCWVTG